MLKTLPWAALAVSLAVSQAWPKSIKLQVRVVGRENHVEQYSYVVPGYSNTSCYANGYGHSASANCYSSGMNSFAGSYSVRGATLSLLLPDGRIAVVNCAPKIYLKPHWGNNWYRSCRAPLAHVIDAQFNGDKAKLAWSVSLDGKTKESETYKILGILPKPAAHPADH